MPAEQMYIQVRDGTSEKLVLSFHMKPDPNTAELFRLVEEKTEEGEIVQLQPGPDWKHTAESSVINSGMTIEQAFRVIASRVQQLVYPKQITPSATPSMRRF